MKPFRIAVAGPRWLEPDHVGRQPKTERHEKAVIGYPATLSGIPERIGTSMRHDGEAVDNPWKPTHDRRPAIEAPDGGHFGAMEEPEILVEDLRAYFRPLN
ncbi:MAG TPA: hypothetical protein VKS60_06645 [Stellaceae bacterium]|nr:hypothetical protein [Stellaceae bacterium]